MLDKLVSPFLLLHFAPRFLPIHLLRHPNTPRYFNINPIFPIY